MENSEKNVPLPEIKHDLMQIAIRYKMPYYEVYEIYAQVKEYIQKEHSDLTEDVRDSYIMKMTEISIKKIAISKGRFDTKRIDREEHE